MAIDPYSPCPGGTGKKLKFCCSDLIGDLEQIDRLIEGDQISSALENVSKLEDRCPGRACVMAIKTKLELASGKIEEATKTGRAMLEAFPENTLALAQSSLLDAVAGHFQEAADRFDRSRDATGAEITADLVRIAATLVQAAAQARQTGFAHGLVEWMNAASLGSDEDRRMLAGIVAGSGVPLALRAREVLAECPSDASYKKEFGIALECARSWKLSRALRTFRSLIGTAGTVRELWVNIAILSEMLARPAEAAQAWIELTRCVSVPYDDQVEAMARAMALEQEANLDRVPMIAVERDRVTLDSPELSIEMIDEKLRQNHHCESLTVDRTGWLEKGTVPPRSAWQIYESPTNQGDSERAIATLLVFGRQTDRPPEAILQGFAPDMEAAQKLLEPLLEATFLKEESNAPMPKASPTVWLLSSRYRRVSPAAAGSEIAGSTQENAEAVDARSREALWNRFERLWPETPLPELQGKSPRDAMKDPTMLLRVDAMITEGEAGSRRADATEAWGVVRSALGMSVPQPVQSKHPLEEFPPLRWHRIVMKELEIDELRGIFLMALEAGFDLAAQRAAEALLEKTDSTPEDHWEALGLLEERALQTDAKLECIAKLRDVAKKLKTSDGMIDVAELRVRLQRGEQSEIARLLDRMRREHSRDRKVIEALAGVLSEAGVDLSSLAAQVSQSAAPQSTETQGIWTPGGDTTGSASGKKAIWTPD